MAISERAIIAVCCGVIFCMALLLVPAHKSSPPARMLHRPPSTAATLRVNLKLIDPDPAWHPTDAELEALLNVETVQPVYEPQAPLSNAQIDQCHAQLKQIVTGRHDEQEARALLTRQQKLQRQLNAWHIQHGSNISEGHTGEMRLQQRWYMLLASIPCVRTVCEIGFNAGHSATVWVAARNDTHLVSFDLGMHDYAFTAMQFYTKTRPGRITQTLGDSSRTVPRAASLMANNCDIVVVDGWHAYEGAATDIKNMKVLANPYFNIFIIDDVFCEGAYWCIGPTKALQEAVDGKVLRLLHRSSLDGQGNVVPASAGHLAVRGFAVGTYL